MGIRLSHKYYVSDAIQAGFRKFPDVAEAYCIKPDFDPQTGTTEAGKTLAKVSRPILPSLLTRYLANTANAGDKFTENLSSPMPVVIEVYTKIDNPESPSFPGYWSFAGEMDGLAIDSNGIFHLPGLRAQLINYSYHATTPDNWTDYCKDAPYTNFYLQLKPLRITAALQLDHRVRAAFKMAQDTNSTAPVFGNMDSDRIDATLSRTYFIDSRAHLKEIRNESWPVPESTPAGAFNSGAKCELNIDPYPMATNATLRDDTPLLENQVKQKLLDVGRLDRGGEITLRGIQTCIQPGTQIEALANTGAGAYPIHAVVQAVNFRFEEMPQTTVLEIA